MSKYAAFLGAVVVDAEHNAIALSEGGGAYSAKTITAGTYFLRGDGTNASDLCKEIADALNSGSANTYSVSIACSIDPSEPCGVVTVTRTAGSATFSLGFADALNTFTPSLIGFAATNTADNASAKASTLTPSCLWVSPDMPASYEPRKQYDRRVLRAQSGRVRGLGLGGPFSVRDVAFRFLDSRRVLEEDNTTDPTATFARFHERHGDGTRFEFHVQTVSGMDLGALSSSTRLDTAWHFDEDTSREFAPARLEPGLPLYDFNLTLLGYQA